MKFVKKFSGHQKVCNYCRHTKTPKVIWKWEPTLKVWYRWSHYSKSWAYWGPSKSGFTTAGWSWYRGYWHHNGFAYKHEKGTWYRYQNRKWVTYNKRVPVNPSLPKGKRQCRTFYKREKSGFSATLAEKKLPRCKVGTAIYMYKDAESCHFLGGKLAYITRHQCKDHSNDEWRRVTKCVHEPEVTGEGLFKDVK